MGNNKVALITGGSKGIGAAIAQALAIDGFDIWLNYRSDHEAASKIAKEDGGSRSKVSFTPL